MKSTIHLMIFLLLGTILSAQPGRRGEEDREKIKAQRVAFLTSELSLTPEESEKFWPVYNLHTEKMRALKPRHYTKGKNKPPQLTDEEANKAIEEMLEASATKLAYDQKLINDLRDILPPQKILALHRAENKFKRRLLGELGKRKRKWQRDN